MKPPGTVVSQGHKTVTRRQKEQYFTLATCPLNSGFSPIISNQAFHRSARITATYKKLRTLLKTPYIKTMQMTNHNDGTQVIKKRI
jgi:hypothetical protein